jgi:hypothetical protein
MRFDLSELTDGSIMDLVDETVLDVTSKVTLDAHGNLVAASPVDTGDFRGAWTVETPNKAYDAGAIENDKEYAAALADGHSPQAPKGWVENSIEAATRL